MMSKRKHTRLVVYLSVFALLAISFTIGYARLSSKLTINGTTGIRDNSWGVIFDDLEVTNGAEYATANGQATIQDDKITILYDVKLPTPGNYYEFETDVWNIGTIAAELEDIEITLIGADEINNQTKNVTRKVCYKEGETPLDRFGEVIYNGSSPAVVTAAEEASCRYPQYVEELETVCYTEDETPYDRDGNKIKIAGTDEDYKVTAEEARTCAYPHYKEYTRNVCYTEGTTPLDKNGNVIKYAGSEDDVVVSEEEERTCAYPQYNADGTKKTENHIDVETNRYINFKTELVSTLLNDMVLYNVKYVDDTALVTKTDTRRGDKLEPDQRRRIKVRVEYNNDILPEQLIPEEDPDTKVQTFIPVQLKVVLHYGQYIREAS